MTAYLPEIVDVRELAKGLLHGHIHVNRHRELDLSIYNYTAKAQYDNYWTTATRLCRGLIVDDYNRVVSRPFEKFFNYGDTANAVVISEDSSIEVTDKVDGSLGILYPDLSQPTGWAVATRGSFHSAQAEHATAVYQRTHSYFDPREGFTYLFEIVYPENRIVVDYGQDDNLYLIGIIRNADGKHLSVTHSHIAIPRTTVFRFDSFGDFLQQYKPRKGVEGVVVRDLSTDAMLKFKTEEYVELHKITFGLNAVVVWEALKDGPLHPFRINNLPTEYLRSWADQVMGDLVNEYADLWHLILDAYADLKYNFPDFDANTHEDRKTLAGFVLTEYPELQKYLFGLVDGRSVSELVWKAVKPRGDNRPTLTQEVG
jgi:RNA ligase